MADAGYCPARLQMGSASVSRNEFVQVENYIRTKLGSTGLGVAPPSRKGAKGVLTLGGIEIGHVVRDDEDGEVTFHVEVRVNAPGVTDMAGALPALCSRLGARDLALAARGRITDSVEVTIAGEHIAVLYREGPGKFFFEMSILDMDLED
jgi:hypothetical protein